MMPPRGSLPWGSGVLALAGAAWGQPFFVNNPQRVVGATGGCCTPGAVSTLASGAWVQGVSAGCPSGGGAGHAEQNSQVAGAFLGGTGSAMATAGGTGCDVQATSSMLVPFDIQTSVPVRAIVRLTGSGTLRGMADIKVLPLLSAVRSWQSPADADETFTLAPGSYRLSVSAGGGVTAPGGAGSATFDFSLERACYANCDGSTMPPILNASDFACFMNRFVAGDTGANCDGSTRPPALNANDFGCFLNAFARGCT